MGNYIMVGCDLHDNDILIRVAYNRDKPAQKSFGNTVSGRKGMIKSLKKHAAEAGDATVVFAYEASYMGFGLYDELTDAGFDCHVLAPTKIARSVKHRRRKTDSRDADRVPEIVRGHMLAGNEMPAVWVPDHQTRNDRELVRMRLEVGSKIIAVKSQILVLLKRNRFRKPSQTGQNWTKRHRAWLEECRSPESALPVGARYALSSLARQLLALEKEVVRLDRHIETLARTKRYALPVRELKKLKGVGTLTAMTYLTEMGDLSRFRNRRQIGAFLGLVPSSFESGERGDRKGHITHHGPPRVRKVLCQAVWSRVRTDPNEKKVYERIVARNPKHKKIAVVAAMRRLGVKMWHEGLKAQQSAGCFQPQHQFTTV
jgi:transposase